MSSVYCEELSRIVQVLGRSDIIIIIIIATHESFTKTRHQSKNKPMKTLQQEFPSPKDRPVYEKQTNVVYKIQCENCDWSYIGETGRCFETSNKEHMRNVKLHTRGSNIANHAWKSLGNTITQVVTITSRLQNKTHFSYPAYQLSILKSVTQ